MIGKVADRSEDVGGLLRYLFGPGRDNEHADQRIVASWCGDTDHLEPPRGEGGKPDVSRLAALMEVGLDLAHGKVPDKPVYHLIIRAHEDDRDLADAEWQDISTEVMHRLGLSERGREEEGCPWVAVHHGDNHVHLTVVLARLDGRPVGLHGDWYRIGETMTWAEEKYGLTVVPRGSKRRTTGSQPKRAEFEKARRAGRAQPARAELKRLVSEAARTAWNEESFFAALAERNVRVRLRYSTLIPGQVTGYSAGLAGDLNADGGQVWYRAGKLAAHLSMPRLQRRWTPGAAPGHRMSSVTARTVLRREVTAAAAASVTEDAFFKNLTARGIDVHLWYDPARPGRVVRYSAGLPGRVSKTGTLIRYSAGTLSPALTLGKLRAHWRKGQSGAADPGLYDGADRDTIYAHAADIAQWAAREVQKNPRCHADVALAAADILNAAADATGNQALRSAADGFMKSVHTGRRRDGYRSPPGQALRISARLLKATRPPGSRGGSALPRLVAAIIGLINAITELKKTNRYLGERVASRRAAAGIRSSRPLSPRR